MSAGAYAAWTRSRLRRSPSSMQEIGLQTPITVYEAENGDIVCIVGAHRVAAAKFLGWSNITCHIVQMNGLARRLWEIDENLCRAELNELERAEHLAARKEIYEQLHPEARQHASGALAANAAMGRGDATDNLSAASFAADTAAKTGVACGRSDVQCGVPRK